MKIYWSNKSVENDPVLGNCTPEEMKKATKVVHSISIKNWRQISLFFLGLLLLMFLANLFPVLDNWKFRLFGAVMFGFFTAQLYYYSLIREIKNQKKGNK